MRFVCQLPGNRFVQSPLHRFQARRSLFFLSKTGPFARNGLSLTRDGLRLREFHPGIKGPGLLLRSLACRSSYSFGFSTPPPVAGLPQHPAASTPQARCILHRPAPPAVPLVFAPLQEFLLPWDQRAGKLRNRSVHLPNSPDLRSLPAAFPLKDSATDHRSRSATFPEACCSSNLLEPSSL